MLNSNKTWEEQKIKHTAEHIGIISEGALKTLVTEIRKRDMEALIGMLNEEKFIQVGNLNDEIAFDRKGYRVGFIAGLNANQAIDKSKQLIKDYYEN